MSASSLISSMASLDREIHSYQQQINSVNSSIHSKQNEAHRIFDNVNREKNLSRMASLQKDLTRKNEEINSLEKNRATKERNLADKQKRRRELQQQLFKEEQKERDKAAKDQKEMLSVQQQINREMQKQKLQSTQSIPFYVPQHRPEMPSINYDVFVSHASEDKEEFVRPFVDVLVQEGLKVWYDEFELSVGDSLRRSIDHGLKNSRFGIIILSEFFLKKEWPQKELDGLFAREVNGEKVILPIWHKISKNEVLSYSPIIADMVALNTSNFTTEELAKEIVKAVKKIP